MNFWYVENVCYVMLDQLMEKEVKNFQTIDATPAMVTQEFTYLRKSHKTLMMFRRTSKDDGKLELRHQRTGDVVFNWHDYCKPQQKPDFYIYKLIEILLPKAMVEKIKAKKDSKDTSTQIPKLRMVELWAQ